MTDIRRGRNPDTIFIIVLLLLSGIIQLISGSRPGSISELVEPWQATAWAAALTTGAALILLGILWRSITTGYVIEALGRSILCPACLAYSFAVWDAAGDTGLPVIAFLVALTMSSTWRFCQIISRLRRLQYAVGQMAEAHNGVE